MFNEAKELTQVLKRQRLIKDADPVVSPATYVDLPRVGELREIKHGRDETPSRPDKSQKLVADGRYRTLIKFRKVMIKHGLKSPSELYGRYSDFLKKCPKEEVDKHLNQISDF